MGQRCMPWTIRRQGRAATRSNLCHRPVIPQFKGRDRLLAVVSIELHWLSRRHLEGFPGGFEVDPLNDRIGGLSEVLRSFWHAEPFVSLGLPAIGMSIALEIGKAESVKVNVVFGCLSDENVALLVRSRFRARSYGRHSLLGDCALAANVKGDLSVAGGRECYQRPLPQRQSFTARKFVYLRLRRQ